MYKYIISLCLLIPYSSFAQLFSDASVNLPDNGAKAASMDVRHADLDADGDLDIVLANEFQANTILLNDGTGLFSNGTLGILPQEIHDSEDVSIADFNDDGILDLVFCSEDDVVIGKINVHEYYLGQDNGSYLAADFELPDSEANAVTHADINGDNIDDLLFGNNGANSILINNGNGSFELSNDRLPSNNKTTQDLAIADLNGDGFLDLFEGNENGNILYLNDGNGFFTNVTSSNLPQGMNIETRKVTAGDVDGDEDLDLFLSNVEFIVGKDRQNRLLINDGNGNFTDATSTMLPLDNDHTIDAIFEDVDFDGDLDLIICNIGGTPIRVYENNGSGIFTDNTVNILGQFYYLDALGVVSGDFNGDGLNDLYICDRKSQNTNNKDLLLFRNSVNNLVENEFEINLTVTPNPSSDNVKIHMQNQIPEQILLTDIDGQVLKKINAFQNDTLNLNLSTFPTGTYIIIAKYSDQHQLFRKILKE